MRHAVVLFSVLLLALNARAQRTEVGFGLGTFNYTGDLARTYSFLNSKPAGTLFYRNNLSKVISFRTTFTAGKLGAVERRNTFPANPSFNIGILELAAGMEYHFMNWRDDKRLLRFTPYLFAGLGLFAMTGTPPKPKGASFSNVQSCIPFGVGVKYVLNPKYYLSLEFGMRKTFFDYLDNVSAIDKTQKSYRNPFDNDAYYFLGLTITRTFYNIPCPTSPYR